jgi:hypothetical protein
MVLALRRNVFSRAIPKTSKSTLNASSKFTSQYNRPACTSRTMNTLQESSRIYRAFKKGGPTFGGWQVRNYPMSINQRHTDTHQLQMLPGTNHARAIARSGVDWICVDCEHGNINDSQMHEAVTAIAHAGVSPLVRIAANEAWMVKRALDCGAHGVIVPLIYTVDDAKHLVSSAKFPPQGITKHHADIVNKSLTRAFKEPVVSAPLSQSNVSTTNLYLTTCSTQTPLSSQSCRSRRNLRWRM